MKNGLYFVPYIIVKFNMTLNCPHCTHEYYIESKFCEQCGYAVNPDLTIEPVCPTCRTTYPPDAWYCINDGSKLLRVDDRHHQAGYNELFNYYEMGYPKAALGDRFIAGLLDGLIVLALSIPALIFFFMGMYRISSYYDRSSAPLFIVIAIILYIAPLTYGLIKDGLGQGQSIGKRSVGLMVISLTDNTPCNKGDSFVRALVSALVSCIPFVGWLVEPIMVLATHDGRKLGDRAGKTQVIEKKYYN